MADNVQAAPQVGQGQQTRGGDPLMNVRDRLFHTLFFKLSLAYARGCPRPIRRMIEMMILLKAILFFVSLMYIHIAYARHPVQCLEDIKGSWPRDGILRVEIMRNPPEFYTVEQSYEKEQTLQLMQRHNEELFYTMFNVFSTEGTLDYTEQAKAEETDEIISEDPSSHDELLSSSESIISGSGFTESGGGGSNDSIISLESTSMSSELLASDSINVTETKIEDLQEEIEQEEKSHTEEDNVKVEKATPPSEDEYIVEYSLEYGFLRLSPATRKKLNITVQIVVLDPDHDVCFGDTFSKFILHNFLGYDDVLMSSIKSLAEHEDNKGFLR